MNTSNLLFFTLVKRECLLYVRKLSQVVNPLLFFFLIISLFPMGMSIEAALLKKIAPGLVWISVLLASLLSIDRLFFYEFESGLLEQKLLSPVPLLQRIYATLLVHWLMTALPLILICPLLGVMYGLSLSVTGSLMLSLLCGTPIITLIIGVLAAMILSAGNRSALISLVFLPLTIPVLIFGSASVLMTQQGLDPTPIYLLLIGLGLMCFALGPFLIRKSLYLAVE